MNTDLARFIAARYGENAASESQARFNAIIINKKFYARRGDFIYEEADGGTFVYYLNGVIASVTLFARQYLFDKTGRLIRVCVSEMYELMGVRMKIYALEFTTQPDNYVRVNMWDRGDGSGRPQGTRAISFDHYIDVFSGFFWPHARDKIWLRILLEYLHQPVAEEIAEHMV